MKDEEAKYCKYCVNRKCKKCQVSGAYTEKKNTCNEFKERSKS
jgi:hypothetical protein